MREGEQSLSRKFCFVSFLLFRLGKVMYLVVAVVVFVVREPRESETGVQISRYLLKSDLRLCLEDGLSRAVVLQGLWEGRSGF